MIRRPLWSPYLFFVIRDLALGDHIFDKFIENKRIEWDNYRSHVHEYKLERYFPVL